MSQHPPIERDALDELSNTVLDTQLELREEVIRMFPVGRLVMMQHGRNLLGPYEITCHQFGNSRYGPDMRGRNIQTGKTRKLGSFVSLRAYPEEC